MNPLSLEEVAALCGGVLRGGTGGMSVSGISKDTRTLVPGDLYVALRGENHDGNAHARAAAAKGAAGAILDRPQADLPDGFPVIMVEDTLAALSRFAEAWRDRLAAKVVCLTGSSGKTSTKEFTAAVLSARFRVVKTEGNLNNHIGLPLSILSASESDDMAVWEIGMNHPGEIAPLAQIARPDIAIITNIGVAHIEFMGSREEIAREKAALVEAVHPDGAVVLPAEDDFKDFLAARSRARVIEAGLRSGTVTASGLTMDADGCRFTLHWEGETAAVRLPVPGEHMVRNAVLAVAAGLECGLGLDECAGALASARLSGGRLARRIVRGVIFFDDTYNANPDSMEAALRTLKAVPVRGRRIAVLGRMGELGDHASAGYQQVGRTASETLDVLIAVGAETVPLTETARGGGLREIYEISSPEEAAGILRSLAKEGDAVLVKGSRSAKMERVIENF